jgi:hypothetical protein
VPLNDASFSLENPLTTAPMCELVIISVAFYTANDNDNFSAFLFFFSLKKKRRFCESEKRSTDLKEYLLMKSTGNVTIGGQSREFSLVARLFIHSLGFSLRCLKRTPYVLMVAEGRKHKNNNKTPENYEITNSFTAQ